VVLKRSSWTKWVVEEADPRIATLLDSGDETVRRMRPGHIDHTETIDEVRAALADLGVSARWHDHPHQFAVTEPCDLVVTVGGDGTLLAASHGIGPGVPLLGVNSAPLHSVGFFCAAVKGGVRAALAAALAGALPRAELTRMRVDLGERCLHRRVLNEALFCHASPAATSRYILRVTARDGTPTEEEEQKSSGLWVGPAAGSTAAQRSAGGRVLPLSSHDIQYVVREPYRHDGKLPRLALGTIGEAELLRIKNKMRQAHVFLDGDHIVHDIPIGEVVTMRQSDEPLTVLGLGGR
jgi:NAD+ kinase